MSSPTVVPKLQAFAAFRHAIKMVWRFRNAGVAIALPWTLLLAGFEVLLGTFQAPATTADIAMRDIALGMISFVCVSAIALHWHRFVLKDEKLPMLTYLKIDGRLGRYLLKLLGAMLVAMFGLLIPMFILQLVIPLGLVSLLAAIPGYAYMIGLSLGLPAVAIDGEPISYRESWRKTRGSELPLLGYAALFMFVAFALKLALDYGFEVVSQSSGGAARLIGPLLEIPLTGFYALVMASALTTLYGVLVEGRKV